MQPRFHAIVLAGASVASPALAGLGLAESRPPLRLDVNQPVESAAAEPATPSEASTSWRQGWSGGVELGLNGSDGNTELFNVRAGANARRQTDRNDTKGDITYTVARQDGEETANRLEANIRNDWIIPDSRWRVFADGKFEYDEFTDYDVRLSAHVGVGYEFIKTDDTFLLGRVGVGFYKEFGSSQNEIVPEGLLGADFEHKFTETQSLTASVDFYPQLDDFGPYRFVAKAAYQIVLNQSNGLTLKLGVEDRYDSTPGEGFKRNDIAYFALLAWTF